MALTLPWPNASKNNLFYLPLLEEDKDYMKTKQNKNNNKMWRVISTLKKTWIHNFSFEEKSKNRTENK